MDKNNVCRCCKDVLPKKNRRFIFSGKFTLKTQLAEVVGHFSEDDGSSSYLCYMCFNKLNKLAKIDFELQNKISILQEEKKDLINKLRGCTNNIAPSYSVSNSPVQTPRKTTKRVLIRHTPTPRKPKKFASLTSATKNLTEVEEDSFLKRPRVAKKRLAEPLVSPEKAKVQIRYAAEKKLRTRTVTEKGMYSVLACIVRGDNLQTIANKFVKIPGMKDKICKCLMKVINKEATEMCRQKHNSILRNTSVCSLSSLDFKGIADEVRSKAPTISLFLACCSNSFDNDISFSVLSAILLRYRNIKMSLLHHVIGQLLDCGGATDETINIMCHLGLSVGPETVHRKRTEMVERQNMLIKNSVISQVMQSQLAYTVQKTKDMVQNLSDDTGPVPCSSDVNVTYTNLKNQSKIIEKGMSNDLEVNYFDMCSSYKNKMYSSCTTNLIDADSTSRPEIDTYTDPLQVNIKIESPIGDIILPSINFHAHVGNQFTTTVQASSKTTLTYGSSFIEKHKDCLNPDKLLPVFDIIGDNIDLTKSPSHMTKEKQRKSYHWFLNVAVQRRVLSSLPDGEPIADIMTVPNSAFIPNADDCASLDNDMIFHILKVITKHITVLQPFSNSVPNHIQHPYMEETAKKSTYYIVDLLDKSENKSDEMIDILEHIHRMYIAHTENDPSSVIERKVFGGDVLTNERAYAAQLAMMNGQTDFFRLAGVVHRPEGLHRMMNSLLVSEPQHALFMS